MKKYIFFCFVFPLLMTSVYAQNTCEEDLSQNLQLSGVNNVDMELVQEICQSAKKILLFSGCTNTKLKEKGYGPSPYTNSEGQMVKVSYTVNSAINIDWITKVSFENGKDNNLPYFIYFNKEGRITTPNGISRDPHEPMPSNYRENDIPCYKDIDAMLMEKETPDIQIKGTYVPQQKEIKKAEPANIPATEKTQKEKKNKKDIDKVLNEKFQNVKTFFKGLNKKNKNKTEETSKQSEEEEEEEKEFFQ